MNRRQLILTSFLGFSGTLVLARDSWSQIGEKLDANRAVALFANTFASLADEHTRFTQLRDALASGASIEDGNTQWDALVRCIIGVQQKLDFLVTVTKSSNVQLAFEYLAQQEPQISIEPLLLRPKSLQQIKEVRDLLALGRTLDKALPKIRIANAHSTLLRKLSSLADEWRSEVFLRALNLRGAKDVNEFVKSPIPLSCEICDAEGRCSSVDCSSGGFIALVIFTAVAVGGGIAAFIAGATGEAEETNPVEESLNLLKNFTCDRVREIAPTNSPFLAQLITVVLRGSVARYGAQTVLDTIRCIPCDTLRSMWFSDAQEIPGLPPPTGSFGAMVLSEMRPYQSQLVSILRTCPGLLDFSKLSVEQIFSYTESEYCVYLMFSMEDIVNMTKSLLDSGHGPSARVDNALGAILYCMPCDARDRLIGEVDLQRLFKFVSPNGRRRLRGFLETCYSPRNEADRVLFQDFVTE